MSSNVSSALMNAAMHNGTTVAPFAATLSWTQRLRDLDGARESPATSPSLRSMSGTSVDDDSGYSPMMPPTRAARTSCCSGHSSRCTPSVSSNQLMLALALPPTSTSPDTTAAVRNAAAPSTSPDTESDDALSSSSPLSAAGSDSERQASPVSPVKADEATSQSAASASSRPAPIIKMIAKTNLPTRKGIYQVYGFQDESKAQRRDGEIIVVVHGDVRGQESVPMRVHDQCYTSEVLGSLKCDCREQLEYAMDFIRDNSTGRGLIVYLPQEGRGIGLLNKLRAYALQEQGYDTVEANLALGLPDESREYYCVPEILRQLEIRSVSLLTNNPRKLRWMDQVGVKVTERLPVLIAPNEYSTRYLHVKQARHGHMMDHLVAEP